MKTRSEFLESITTLRAERAELQADLENLETRMHESPEENEVEALEKRSELKQSISEIETVLSDLEERITCYVA